MELSENNAASLLRENVDDHDLVFLIRNVMDLMLHRIRNDLSSCRTLISLLKNNFLDQDKKEEAFLRIDSSCRDLLEICEKAESLSTEAGKPISKEWFNPVDLVLQAVNKTKQITGKDKLDIEVDTTGDVVLELDAQKTELVISELIINAGKFCRPGSSLKINILNRVDGCEIHFVDNGPGIDADIRPALFKNLITTTTADGMPRLGFGLLFCHLLLSQLGGRIELVDNGLRGAHFKLALPKAAMGGAGHE